jgi:phenylpyruvate tautomerase PptA (4-oxalocrotonate tautomerase family)
MLGSQVCRCLSRPADHWRSATALDAARTVRIQVITPPAALSREGQTQLVADATKIAARISGDSTQAGRTWVLLTEAAEGGWGIAGTAFGSEEFAALLR